MEYEGGLGVKPVSLHSVAIQKARPVIINPNVSRRAAGGTPVAALKISKG